MGFHEVRFPTEIAYGSSGGPGFSTAIIEVDSGAEERVARWSGARRRYNAAWLVKSLDDLVLLHGFYIRRQGPAFGFRFKDFLDFTTASNGQDAPSDTDQQLGVGDASETQFQLVKKYADGVVTRTRNLTKPVAGTTVVSLDDVPQPSGWSVSATTGVVTFSSAPGGSVVVKAGCEFDVPVRFGQAVDESLSAAIQNFDVGAVPDVPLVEIRDEGAVADEFWCGGSDEFDLTANRQVAELDGRVLDVTPDQNGWKVAMPDPAGLPYGGIYFVLHNRSGSYSFILADENFSSLGTVSAGGDAIVVLGKVSAAKQWIGIIV